MSILLDNYNCCACCLYASIVEHCLELCRYHYILSVDTLHAYLYIYSRYPTKYKQSICDELCMWFKLFTLFLFHNCVTEWKVIPEVQLQQNFVHVFLRLLTPALCTNQNLIKTSGCTSQDSMN